MARRPRPWMVLATALAGASTLAACQGTPVVGERASGAAGGSVDGATDVGADAAVPLTRSVGCDQVPAQALARFVMFNETVPDVGAAYLPTYAQRVYWVRLPNGYDPGVAYPTVLLGPGCGASGDSSIPLQVASGDDAILVGLNGIDNCFNKDAADTPELPYFDETLKRVEAAYCVDPSHVFVAGFSSGSWLTNYLGCVRGDRIRAQGSSAGGLPPIPPACTGPIPAMFAADTDDNKNPPSDVRVALDRVRAANGCSDETEPYDFGMPSPCVQYKGCKVGFPVVSCVTSGLGHADQSTTGISTYGFWHFWTSLP